MPMINIEDAYILNETGEQVDKVTGLFTKDEDTTEEEKAFAQLNIGASGGGGGGGRNLFNNPFFTVNQRGVTSGTITDAAVVGPDRWHLFQCSWSVANNAITLAWGGGGTAAGFLQRTGPEVGYALVGKTCTISAYINGTLYAKTVQIKEPGYGAQDLLLGEGVNIRVITDALSGNRGVEVQFRTTSTTNVTIGPVKFELGSVSTLANDAPPEYAEELMKCNFYDIKLKTSAQYGYLGYGIADSATSATILIPLPNNMRDATPTITTGGTIAVKGGTSGTHTMTGITFKLRVTGGVLVTVATTGLTTGEFCLLQLNNTSSYINLSADL